jgi:SAM-dependent methyltransferase
VTGVDTNKSALERARQADPLTVYREGDMRALEDLGETFDGILILWQSFGNFDAAVNARIARQIADLLNPHGRFFLDVYNRAFFENHLGERRFKGDSGVIIETKTMRGDRLRVELDYGDERDTFEWQIFCPDEISALAAQYGLSQIVRCANFDPMQPVATEIPRMQFVFEKP